MITIVSDTHSHDGHALTGEALTAVQEADTVIHAGDFTSPSALSAFQAECQRLCAVHGNADSPAVRDRLPTDRVVEADGLTIAVTHRRGGGELELALFGRSRGADIVVSGHTHRPTVVETEDVLLVNPGSHAQPRGNRPGFAVINESDAGWAGVCREPDGTLISEFEIRRDGVDTVS